MKKHYGKYPGGTNYYMACGLFHYAFYTTDKDKATRIKSKVTCKNCRRTKLFKRKSR